MMSMRVADDLGRQHEKVTYGITQRQRERMSRLGDFGAVSVDNTGEFGSDSDSNMD